jgi:hypothetical protein
VAAVTIEVAEDFSIARNANTIGSPEWVSVTGGGADIVPCPSGFGWALSQDTSVATDHSIQRNIITARNGMGFAAMLTLDMPSGDTTWRPIYRAFLNAAAPSLWFRYQPSTNTFKVAYVNTGSETDVAGATFSGPADPTQPFHVAIEVARSATVGTVKAWLDGTQVLNLSGVNTGNNANTFNRQIFYAPTSTGAGQTTMGNVLAWNTASYSWDGTRKVIQRLAPVLDVGASGWSGSAPYWEKLDDTTTSTQSNTNGSIRVVLANMTIEPEEVFGLWVYWRPASGSGFSTLHEPSYDHVGSTFTGINAFAREYIAGPNSGGDWTQSRLNDLELSFTRNGSGTLDIPYGHILVLHSVEIAGPPTGNLAETLDGATLDALTNLTAAAELAVTLDDTALASSVQVTGNIVVDAEIALDGVTLASLVQLNVVGVLGETLDDVSAGSFAIVGSLGPFTRWPLIVVN